MSAAVLLQIGCAALVSRKDQVSDVLLTAIGIDGGGMVPAPADQIRDINIDLLDDVALRGELFELESIASGPCRMRRLHAFDARVTPSAVVFWRRPEIAVDDYWHGDLLVIGEPDVAETGGSDHVAA